MPAMLTGTPDGGGGTAPASGARRARRRRRREPGARRWRARAAGYQRSVTFLARHRSLLALALVLIASALASGPAHAAAPAKLSLSAAAPRRAVAPGATVRVTAVVTNRSRAAVRGVRLRVAAPRGVRIALASTGVRARARRGVLALGTLRAQARRTIVVRLTPSATAAARATATLTVSGRGSRGVTRRIALKVRGGATPAPNPNPNPTPTPAPDPVPQPPANPLVGRYFFTYTGLEADGVVFVNASFAYRGFPSGGFPVCTAPTAANDDADGCVPYSYDAASGAIVLGGRPGSYTGGKLTLTTRTDASLSYDELQVPAAGTTVQFQGESLSSVGICPPSCTYVATGVTLYADGQFALSAAVSSTTPDGGVTSLPPDKRGTYTIQPGAKLQLTFADGHVAARTIALVPNSDGTTSLFLDDTYYLP